MTKLSDTQSVILSHASQHAGLLASAPANLPAAARLAMFRSMLKNQLLEKVPAPAEHRDFGWRLCFAMSQYVGEEVCMPTAPGDEGKIGPYSAQFVVASRYLPPRLRSLRDADAPTVSELMEQRASGGNDLKRRCEDIGLHFVRWKRDLSDASAPCLENRPSVAESSGAYDVTISENERAMTSEIMRHIGSRQPQASSELLTSHELRSAGCDQPGGRPRDVLFPCTSRKGDWIGWSVSMN
jgi:hypothetical protein